MKLYLNDTSPFSRAVLATMILAKPDNAELVWVDPWQSPGHLKRVNPFCSIPVLELDDGTALVESLCICQYLVAAYQPEHLHTENLSDSSAMQLQGLAKTLMEVSFRTVALTRFSSPENEWIARGDDGVKGCLLHLENAIAAILEQNTSEKKVLAQTITTLYLHAALDYVEFRHNAIFSTCAGPNIASFLERSPYKAVLNRITPKRLGSQPSFNDLLSEPAIA